MSTFKEHLAKLTKCKADLATTLKGTPIAAGDATNLQAKLDAMIANVKQYLACTDAAAKDIAAIKALEAKLAPAIGKMNGLLDKVETDATTAQNMVGKMTGIMSKLPAFQKANAAIDACYDEVFGIRSKAGVKMKADGNLNL
jgi:hypothetical protein